MRGTAIQEVLQGVGPDAPIETRTNGAQQSLHRWRFDLIDGPALFVLARVLDYGAQKYQPNHWRGLPLEDHLNATIMHAYAYLAGDRTDDHLGHMFCRAMFAVATALVQGYRPRQADENNEQAGD